MITAGTWYPPAAGTGSFLANPPFAPMTDPIPNRDHQHGGIENVGEIAQNLKAMLRSPRGHWRHLSSGEQEALDMISHKIARILSGADPHDPEHWTDIAGYAIAPMRALNLLDQRPGDP